MGQRWMHAAGFSLVMNMMVAGLFTASYVAIALMNPGYRAPVWFAAAYGVGILTPIAQLGLGYSGWSTFFGLMVYFSFAGGLLLLLPAIAVFYRQRPPWKLITSIAVVAMVLMPVQFILPRATFPRELAYQTPFILSVGACAWWVLRYSPRHVGDYVLAALLGLLAAHFPVKAFVASQIGTGSQASDYINSTYALISQVSSGALLMATGLALLIKSLQDVIRENRMVAETDPLSGTANRRGFDAQAERMLERARKEAWLICVMLLDLDHFKQVNDKYGHAVGDATIRAFGALLLRNVPHSSLVARMGGEEFVVLLERTELETAYLHAEAIRRAVMTNREEGVPTITVSIGVAEIRSPYELQKGMAKADAALYDAKNEGRNRVKAAASQHTLNV